MDMCVRAGCNNFNNSCKYIYTCLVGYNTFEVRALFKIVYIRGDTIHTVSLTSYPSDNVHNT